MRFVGSLLIILTCSHGWAKSRIDVKPYSRISEERIVTLDDISTLNIADEGLRNKLSKLEVGKGPSLGQQRAFSNERIARLIRQNLPASGDVALKIPIKAIVENRGYELSRESVEKELLNNWKNGCEDCRLVFRSLSLPMVPKALWGQKWQLVEPVRRPKGTFSVQIAIGDVPDREQVFWITGRAEVHKQVPVASKILPMGHTVQDGDVSYEYKDVTLATDTAPNTKELVGMNLRRSVKAGDILWHGVLIRPTALKRGDTVRVTAGSGSWTVSILGVAQQDGYLGDVVRVKNSNTNKTFLAEVTGNGEVLVK